MMLPEHTVKFDDWSEKYDDDLVIVGNNGYAKCAEASSNKLTIRFVSLTGRHAPWS